MSSGSGVTGVTKRHHSSSRRYNLVLYMCCVYIVTYLAWNSHTAPHTLIAEHSRTDHEQSRSYVRPDVDGVKQRVPVVAEGNVDFDRTTGVETTDLDDFVVAQEAAVESVEDEPAGGPEDETGEVEAEWEGEESEGGGSGSSGRKGRRGRKRKHHKYHPTHVAMSKSSIPLKGKPLVTPWKDLRGKCCRTLGTVTDKMIDSLPDEDLVDPNKTHYGTCAVVGSAGLLLTQDFGEEIDAHDAIFRFNIAPAKGFERHVGSRTTIRMINRHHLGFREFDDEVCLFHTTVDEAMRKYMRIRQKHPHLPNVPMDMSFYKKVVEWNKLETPTNGYFGLKLALMLCDRIDIYGFLRTWKGYVKYHYFNDEEPNSRQLSRDTKGEMPIILDLLQKHADKIRFRHPCIVDQSCVGCPEGARCDGQTPYAVPLPGYCKVEGKECFLKCKKPSHCKGKHARCSPQQDGYSECQ